MRSILLVLATIAVSACNDKPAAPSAEAQPAAMTFDGANSADQSALLAHGERLSHILGCRGCHTPTLEGHWFNDDEPDMGKIYATNLTRVLPDYSDAQLETLLREGTHPTRGDLWIMPSEVFQRLSEPDMKALIAHLRTVKPSGAPTPPPAPSAKAKAEMASGKLKPTSFYVAEYRKLIPPDFGESHALGRYIAANTCAECHGGDLNGIQDFAPNLDVAGAYSAEELTRLLTTGQGKTAKDIGLMARVGKTHFGYLTPRERAAVVAYIKARAERVSE